MGKSAGLVDNKNSTEEEHKTELDRTQLKDLHHLDGPFKLAGELSEVKL